MSSLAAKMESGPDVFADALVPVAGVLAGVSLPPNFKLRDVAAQPTTQAIAAAMGQRSGRGSLYVSLRANGSARKRGPMTGSGGGAIQYSRDGSA